MNIKRKKKLPGPAPQILEIEGNWRDALKHMLTAGARTNVLSGEGAGKTAKKAGKKKRKG